MAEKKEAPAGKALTKTETYAQLATTTGLTKKQVSELFDALGAMIKKELGKKGPGVFTLPGLLKLTRVLKPATKAGERPNPFAPGTMMAVKAKKARNVVKARPLKNLKDMVS